MHLGARQKVFILKLQKKELSESACEVKFVKKGDLPVRAVYLIITLVKMQEVEAPQTENTKTDLDNWAQECQQLVVNEHLFEQAALDSIYLSSCKVSRFFKGKWHTYDNIDMFFATTENPNDLKKGRRCSVDLAVCFLHVPAST